MLPINGKFNGFQESNNQNFKVYAIVAIILLIGGTSLVFPEMLDRGVFVNLHVLRGALYGKGIMFLPFILIAMLFLCSLKFSHASSKWFANIGGVFVSIIPTYFFVYLANSPQGDALSAGICVGLAFVSALTGYLFGWVLVGLITKALKR